MAMSSVGCPAAAKVVVYDLARRVAVADRWSSRDVILFGTPAAEPHQADGFHREAGGAEGDSFLWSKRQAEVSLTWDDVVARAAVVDLAPYASVKKQSVVVSLNGTEVGRFVLNDVRHRYSLRLPAKAQRAGENRLRFAFARAASPADADPKNPDKRALAASFYSLVVGRADDGALEALLGRGAPRPFSVAENAGIPTLTQVGPGVIRYALRLPARAELRFVPDLHSAARTAGASASFRVTVEAQPGHEREVWRRVIGTHDKRVAEVAVRLPGAAGTIVRLGLHVGGVGGDDRFAWGTWTAPRVVGVEGSVQGFAPAPLTSEEASEGASLREEVAGVNVVLVILDAARAHELGCYGYGRATTPEIDRIAAEGVVFENAFTPAVYTLGAMSSLWTSQHPDRHHSEVSFSARLPKDRLTLAEVLGAQGIHTAGFVANSVAGTAFGFDRGFSEFHEVYRQYGSQGDVFRKTVHPWLQSHKDRRFFAYVHFREPHFPYDPPPPFNTRFGPDGPIPAALRKDPVAFGAWITDGNQGRRSLSAEEREHLLRLYDGNLAFADQEVGALRRALEAEGLWDRTVLIVAADHGEGMSEHGWVGHNVHVYEEAVHVPLVVRFPAGKGPAGARVAGLVDLLDLAPTIADLFGALGRGGSDEQFEGRSLLPVVAGAPGKPAVLSRTVWDRPVYALRDEAFKFVYDTRTGEERLFDLVSDPGETRDVRWKEPIRAAYFREALHQWTLDLGRRRVTATEAIERFPDPSQCENMKALGYLGNDVQCPVK
ncbi:MAG: sulfatase [Acidobacteria bacterium]|nr:sulfatase [Acidobacteriota bacterium]